jgi:hypothetical protein
MNIFIEHIGENIMFTKSICMTLLTIAFITFELNVALARCDHPDDYDSAGRRCGGRAASVIPGGRLGGDGYYQDSQGRQRVYGKNNDPYDKPSNSSGYSGYGNNSKSQYDYQLYGR